MVFVVYLNLISFVLLYFLFDGKIVFVIGGFRGIGFEVVCGLFEVGVLVVFIYFSIKFDEIIFLVVFFL